MKDHVLIAVFGAPHGVKGELRVKSFAGDPADFDAYGPLRDARGRSYEVLSKRPLKDDMFVVRVKGCDDRDAAADFLRDRAVSYPSIFDPPGRSLLALRGFPRNVVPSTIVLDREGRVAAVFLTAVLAADIEPTIRRIASELPVSVGGGP